MNNISASNACQRSRILRCRLGQRMHMNTVSEFGKRIVMLGKSDNTCFLSFSDISHVICSISLSKEAMIIMSNTVDIWKFNLHIMHCMLTDAHHAQKFSSGVIFCKVHCVKLRLNSWIGAFRETSIKFCNFSSNKRKRNNLILISQNLSQKNQLLIGPIVFK